MTSLPAVGPEAVFTVVRRGYDRAQVDEHIEMLTTQLRTAIAARNSALGEVEVLSRRLDAQNGELQGARAEAAQRRADADALRAQVAELSTIPHTVDGMSERLQQMVRIAQDEVNDMRTRATTSASHVLSLAQAEADELREDSERERAEFESERRTAQEALRSQLEESRARLEQLRNDSDGQRSRLDAELAERRAEAEHQLADEMEERRTTLLSELAEQEAARREDAARVVESAAQQVRAQLAEAGAETQRIRAEARADVAAAQRELEELRALQHQVSEQLTAVRALLDWTLPQMSGAGVGEPRSDAIRSVAPPIEELPAGPGRNGGAPAEITIDGEPVEADAIQPDRRRSRPGSDDRPTPAARSGRLAAVDRRA